MEIKKKEKEGTLLTFAPASSSFFAHSIFPCIAESISGVFASKNHTKITPLLCMKISDVNRERDEEHYKDRFLIFFLPVCGDLRHQEAQSDPKPSKEPKNTPKKTKKNTAHLFNHWKIRLNQQKLPKKKKKGKNEEDSFGILGELTSRRPFAAAMCAA